MEHPLRRRARRFDPVDPDTAMSDDTIAYSDDDIAALHAMLDHKCTPRWWPHHIGDTWTCPECAHHWVCDEARNMGGVSAKAIALGLLDPLTLGWRTA